MKSTVPLAFVLALTACETTTKGEGPSGSSSSSTSSSTSSGGSSTSSSTSSGGSSTSSSGGVSSAQCQSVCISKVYECNPDATDVPASCEGICSGGSYSQQQLDCFRNASCFDLSNATYLEDVCPP